MKMDGKKQTTLIFVLFHVFAKMKQYNMRRCNFVLMFPHLIVKKKQIYKRSHRRCRIKSVLKNFAIFTGKYLCWSLFTMKLPSLQACNFTKKRLQHGCFPVNIAKFLRLTSKSIFLSKFQKKNSIWDEVFKNGPSKICGRQPLLCPIQSIYYWVLG